MNRPESNCWNRIGAAGDQSCPELPRHVHCRNCPVFAEGARQLLERGLPDGYALEWASVLAEPVQAEKAFDRTVNVFRVGAEWLALPAAVFQEVVAIQPVRVIPHRSNAVLLGLVSVRGAMHLCFSMSALLGIPPSEGHPAAGAQTAGAQSAGAVAGPAARAMISPRHCLLLDQGQGWVFQAQEVLGVCHFHAADLRPPPATVAHALPQFSQGLIEHAGRAIGVLDPGRLFKALAKVVA